jgi:hypothetical protein
MSTFLPSCLLIGLLVVGGTPVASGLEKVADLPTGVWSMGFAKLGEESSTLVLGGMDGQLWLVNRVTHSSLHKTAVSRLVSGKNLPGGPKSLEIDIQPGLFRVLDVLTDED